MAGDAKRWDVRRLYGDVVWIAFVVVQAMDGLFTYVGMQLHGIAAEANPLIAWYAATYGITASVLFAKLFAALCGAVLHASARHQVLAVLTLTYSLVAIWPWTMVLWP
jgi:hypothetical protein